MTTMQATLVRASLLERLKPIFGSPRNLDGLAEEVCRHVPAWADGDALEMVAEKIIAVRKAKGFPSAAELISSVKLMRRAAADETKGPMKEARFDGERSVVWVKRSDPRWRECAAQWDSTHAKPCFAMTSKYADGEGWFFPAYVVDSMPPSAPISQARR